MDSKSSMDLNTFIEICAINNVNFPNGVSDLKRKIANLKSRRTFLTSQLHIRPGQFRAFCATPGLGLSANINKTDEQKVAYAFVKNARRVLHRINTENIAVDERLTQLNNVLCAKHMLLQQ